MRHLLLILALLCFTPATLAGPVVTAPSDGPVVPVAGDACSDAVFSKSIVLKLDGTAYTCTSSVWVELTPDAIGMRYPSSSKWGCVPDGGDNQSTCVQEVIDQTNANGGGEVLLGDGDWCLNVRLKTGVTLAGLNGGGVGDAPGARLFPYTDDPVIRMDDADNTVRAGLKKLFLATKANMMLCDGVTASTANGIEIIPPTDKWVDGLRVEDVRVASFGGDGIYMAAAGLDGVGDESFMQNFRFDGVEVVECAGSGLKIEGQLIEGNFRNLYLSLNGDDGQVGERADASLVLTKAVGAEGYPGRLNFTNAVINSTRMCQTDTGNSFQAESSPGTACVYTPQNADGDDGVLIWIGKGDQIVFDTSDFEEAPNYFWIGDSAGNFPRSVSIRNSSFTGDQDYPTTNGDQYVAHVSYVDGFEFVNNTVIGSWGGDYGIRYESASFYSYMARAYNVSGNSWGSALGQAVGWQTGQVNERITDPGAAVYYYGIPWISVQPNDPAACDAFPGDGVSCDDLDYIYDEDGGITQLQHDETVTVHARVDFRDFTIRHGVGNILLSNGVDAFISEQGESVTLSWDSNVSKWRELSRMDALEFPTVVQGISALDASGGKVYVKIVSDNTGESTMLNYVELDAAPGGTGVDLYVNMTCCITVGQCNYSQYIPAGYSDHHPSPWDCGEVYPADAGTRDWGWDGLITNIRERTWSGPNRNTGFVYVSGAGQVRIWEADVTPGAYTVTVGTGDLNNLQGPHKVYVSTDEVTWYVVVNGVSTPDDTVIETELDTGSFAGREITLAASTPSASYTITLPDDDGTSGQVMAHGGADLPMTWETPVPGTTHGGSGDEVFTSDGLGGVVAEDALTFEVASNVPTITFVGQGSFMANEPTVDGDGRILFDSQTDEEIRWDRYPGNFYMSDDLIVADNFTATDITATADMFAQTITLGGSTAALDVVGGAYLQWEDNFVISDNSYLEVADYIQSGGALTDGSLKLLEAAVDGTAAVTFTVDNVTTSYDITLPNADGTSGQVLTHAGAGNPMTWGSGGLAHGGSGDELYTSDGLGDITVESDLLYDGTDLEVGAGRLNVGNSTTPAAGDRCIYFYSTATGSPGSLCYYAASSSFWFDDGVGGGGGGLEITNTGVTVGDDGINDFALNFGTDSGASVTYTAATTDNIVLGTDTTIQGILTVTEDARLTEDIRFIAAVDQTIYGPDTKALRFFQADSLGAAVDNDFVWGESDMDGTPTETVWMSLDDDELRLPWLTKLIVESLECDNPAERLEVDPLGEFSCELAPWVQTVNMDTLAELNTVVTDATLYDGPHTTDTSANTVCTGTTTYLDGEGGCDDLSAVYEPAGITESDISDLVHTTDTTVAHSGSADQMYTSDGAGGVVAESTLTYESGIELSIDTSHNMDGVYSVDQALLVAADFISEDAESSGQNFGALFTVRAKDSGTSANHPNAYGARFDAQMDTNDNDNAIYEMVGGNFLSGITTGAGDTGNTATFMTAANMGFTWGTHANYALNTLAGIVVNMPGSNPSGLTAVDVNGLKMTDVTNVNASNKAVAIRIQAQNGTYASATDGNIYFEGGQWDDGHLELGGAHIYRDSSNHIRIKNGVPTSETSGKAVVHHSGQTNHGIMVWSDGVSDSYDTGTEVCALNAGSTCDGVVDMDTPADPGTGPTCSTDMTATGYFYALCK